MTVADLSKTRWRHAMPIDAETSRRCVRVRNKFTEKNEDSAELPHHGAPLRDDVRVCDARSFGVGDVPSAVVIRFGSVGRVK